MKVGIAKTKNHLSPKMMLGRKVFVLTVISSNRSQKQTTSQRLRVLKIIYLN